MVGVRWMRRRRVIVDVKDSPTAPLLIRADMLLMSPWHVSGRNSCGLGSAASPAQ